MHSASEFVKLKAFHQFADTTEALANAAALVESKLGSDLKSFLKKNIIKKNLQDDHELGKTRDRSRNSRSEG